eukprot:TRINITY_DN14860_c0_g1_i1.p1 TRINITY_DN14860_c0_g1~~TRINITY_DN14860_c0_g1_i1.p1  ORF type:complete len:361 (-),score=59.62 TRINITY_DN14860_c0_g1_i1:70-1152(-)
MADVGVNGLDEWPPLLGSSSSVPRAPMGVWVNPDIPNVCNAGLWPEDAGQERAHNASSTEQHGQGDVDSNDNLSKLAFLKDTLQTLSGMMAEDAENWRSKMKPMKSLLRLCFSIISELDAQTGNAELEECDGASSSGRFELMTCPPASGYEPATQAMDAHIDTSSEHDESKPDDLDEVCSVVTSSSFGYQHVHRRDEYAAPNQAYERLDQSIQAMMYQPMHGEQQQVHVEVSSFEDGRCQIAACSSEGLPWTKFDLKAGPCPNFQSASSQEQINMESIAGACTQESIWYRKKIEFVKALGKYQDWCKHWEQQGYRSEGEPVTPRRRAGQSRSQLSAVCHEWRRAIVFGPPTSICKNRMDA